MKLVFCHKLLFADDLKLYQEIKFLANCLNLQEILISISRWYKYNSLSLNIAKCSTVTYSKKQTFITYSINDSTLLRLDKIRDFGIIFEQSFYFTNYIFDIVSKAFKVYGFIVRN